MSQQLLQFMYKKTSIYRIEPAKPVKECVSSVMCQLSTKWCGYKRILLQEWL